MNSEKSIRSKGDARSAAQKRLPRKFEVEAIFGHSKKEVANPTQLRGGVSQGKYRLTVRLSGRKFLLESGNQTKKRRRGRCFSGG